MGPRARFLLWAAAALPALAALAGVALLAACVPEPDAWRAAFGEGSLCLSWRGILDFEGEPRQIGFRLLHLGLLALPGTDFRHLPLFSWLLAAWSFAAVWRLAAPAGAPGRSAALLPVVFLLLGLAWFSPSFGADWLLAERFRVFLPAACFLGGLLLLLRGRRWSAAFWAALVLAQVALWAGSFGAAVWAALVPAVWSEARRREQGAVLYRVAVWCLAGTLGTGLALPALLHPADPFSAGIVNHLLQDPLGAGGFLLQAAAAGLPGVARGSTLDARIAGAALLAAGAVLAGWLLVAALRGRRLPPPPALPWACCALMGATTALLLADRYYPPFLAGVLLREAAWGTLLLPVGVAGLFAVLAPGAARRLAPFALVLLAAALVLDWHQGLRHLHLERRMLRQVEAQVLLPGGEGGEGGEGAPAYAGALERATAEDLRRRGLLRRLRPLPAEAVEELEVASGAAPAGMLFSLEIRPGALVVRGAVRPGGVRRAADVVLLTRRPPGGAEVPAGFAVPDLFAGGEGIPFQGVLPLKRPLEEGEVVRAFGLDGSRRLLLPLEPAFVHEAGGFVRLPEAGG